jgi:hypothetical protein
MTIYYELLIFALFLTAVDVHENSAKKSEMLIAIPGIKIIVFHPPAIAASKHLAGVNIFKFVSNGCNGILFLMYFTATRSTSDG